MKENNLKAKRFLFAIRIVNLSKFLSAEKKEYILSKQVVRSGTSIGAMIREAEHSKNKNDFYSYISYCTKRN